LTSLRNKWSFAADCVELLLVDHSSTVLLLCCYGKVLDVLIKKH